MADNSKIESTEATWNPIRARRRRDRNRDGRQIDRDRIEIHDSTRQGSIRPHARRPHPRRVPAMSDTDERRSLLARQLDLEQIRTETTARINALNFAGQLGRPSSGNLDQTLRIADRITAWIMTGQDRGALMEIGNAKPPILKDIE
jgi:hypothetical protein